MILAIETSAEPASIALLKKSGEIVSRSFPNKNKVDTLLAEELASLLEDTPLETILVGAGPGSYSGARVGLATAEAIALVHQAEVVLTPSIRGIQGCDNVLIGDARQGAYFIQKYSDSTPSVMEFAEIEKLLKESKHPLKVVTFESPSKLDKLPLDPNSVQQIYSTASSLLNYWENIEDSELKNLKENEQQIIYLKPPNITKPKNPFA